MHGAGTKAARAKSKRVVEQKKHAKELRRLVEMVDVTAEEGLMNEVRRGAGAILYTESVLAELAPEALVWGKAQTDDVEASEFPGINTREKAGLNIWLEWWMEERRMHVKTCATAIKCGILRREIELQEQLMATVVTIIRRIIIALGLSPTDPGVSTIVARELRAQSAIEQRRTA